MRKDNCTVSVRCFDAKQHPGYSDGEQHDGQRCLCCATAWLCCSACPHLLPTQVVVYLTVLLQLDPTRCKVSGCQKRDLINSQP